MAVSKDMGEKENNGRRTHANNGRKGLRSRAVVSYTARGPVTVAPRRGSEGVVVLRDGRRTHQGMDHSRGNGYDEMVSSTDSGLEGYSKCT